MASKQQGKRPAPARPLISNGPGASDDNSGGGNASGTPDADTAMRPGGNPPPGDVKDDRRRLFPDAPGRARSSEG